MPSKRNGLGKGLDSLIPDRNSRIAKNESKHTKTTAIKNEIETLDETKSNVRTSNESLNYVENSNEKEIELNIRETKNDGTDIEMNSSEGGILVKLNQVEPNRNQPRKEFDEDALLELADSIKQFGILQPLLVKKKNDYYEIIAGERRWRAAKIAGLKEVPVLIKEYTDQEIVEISLIENIQRENLNPIEEAVAFKRLLEEFHLKQDEVAERVSKSRTAEIGRAHV